MVGRYEISNENWARITNIVSPTQVMGRPRRDDRQVLNGIFWVLCSGAKWRDLPERYGPWSTAYERFRKWRDDGTFEAILSRLQLRLREDGLMDLDTWMIDSTSIRATRAAAGGGKKGAQKITVDHALGRSRGGLTTKIHLVCDSHGWPLAFPCLQDSRLILDISSRRWRVFIYQAVLEGLRKRSRYVVADKGYDSDELRRY